MLSSKVIQIVSMEPQLHWTYTIQIVVTKDIFYITEMIDVNVITPG